MSEPTLIDRLNLAVDEIRRTRSRDIDHKWRDTMIDAIAEIEASYRVRASIMRRISLLEKELEKHGNE